MVIEFHSDGYVPLQMCEVCEVGILHFFETNNINISLVGYGLILLRACKT